MSTRDELAFRAALAQSVKITRDPSGYDPDNPTADPTLEGEPPPKWLPEYDTVERLRAERDALAKRVEELESLILDYCGRDTSALRIQILGEAKAIAERRAGRAK